LGLTTLTSIYANADGLHDAASHRIDLITLHAERNNQKTRVAIDIKSTVSTVLYRQTNMLVMSTYIHSKAQTPLGRFVVDILYKQVYNKYTKNRTNGA